MNQFRLTMVEKRSRDIGNIWQRRYRGALIACGCAAVLLVTWNLLACFPYLLAGWPSVRTAFWLLRNDPWRARAWVTFVFHLAMAGFLASLCALAILIFCAFLQAQYNLPVNESEVMISVLVIALSCVNSILLGCIGALIALRHGVRVFVIADLDRRCQGDFSRILSVTSAGFGMMNPANYIVAVAVGVPVLAVFGVILANGINPLARDMAQPSEISILTTLATVITICVVMTIKVSNRVVARTPSGCWGATPPADHPQSERQ